MIAFISGHLDLTQEEFDEHYLPLIQKAIQCGDEFIVGDAEGADYMAQQYLRNIFNACPFPISTAPVRVYHMFNKPRNAVGFKLMGGFLSDKQRDEAMTAASDYDISWVRPGREKSGTAKNIARRKKI
jgi:hypothetical protein